MLIAKPTVLEAVWAQGVRGDQPVLSLTEIRPPVVGGPVSTLLGCAGTNPPLWGMGWAGSPGA